MHCFKLKFLCYSNNENCHKCLKTIKGDSICCSTYNKWYHFKCSNLKKRFLNKIQRMIN